jgi:hypothetical protein
MSGGRMRSGSAFCARYLVRRIVAVADGLIDEGDRATGALDVGAGVGVPVEPAELVGLVGEAPGAVTLRILPLAHGGRARERAPGATRGAYTLERSHDAPRPKKYITSALYVGVAGVR